MSNPYEIRDPTLPPSSSTMAPSRSSKKKRPTPIEPLGAPRSKSAKNVVKDEEELALEEAVFGRSRAAAPELLGALSREEVEVEDERETGLERTRDENVRPLLSSSACPELPRSSHPHYSSFSWTSLRSQKSLLRPPALRLLSSSLRSPPALPPPRLPTARQSPHRKQWSRAQTIGNPSGSTRPTSN